MRRQLIICMIVTVFSTMEHTVFAQTTEMYSGHKRFGVDIMWFNYFQNTSHQNSPFLFFSRNRASTDYKNRSGLFGSVNAVSYNFDNGLGFVVVGSLLNTGFTTKLGIQFYKQKGDFMFFGWAVADVKRNGNVDIFGMFRHQYRLSDRWKWFIQLELFPVYHPVNDFWFLTQRIRVGPKVHKSSFGLMADFSQSGQRKWNTDHNLGAYIRHTF